MIRVFMHRMEKMENLEMNSGIESNENTSTPKEFEVYIKVTITRPVLNAEPYIGISFKNVSELTLSETTLTFAEMKKVMEFHNLKNWEEVKNFIEDKYNKYYSSIFFNT